jgi:hypothetical protein
VRLTGSHAQRAHALLTLSLLAHHHDDVLYYDVICLRFQIHPQLAIRIRLFKLLLHAANCQGAAAWEAGQQERASEER